VDSGRLEALSDGVIAVAITLLVFNLAVPVPGHGSLAGQLASHWPAFAAYVVSFLRIGIAWVNHHGMFRSFARVDRVILFLNLLLLFFIVTIPFATATLASYLSRGGPDAALAAAIYQGVFLGMTLSLSGLLWWSIRRGNLKPPLAGARARLALIRFARGNALYAVGIGIAFLSAPASLLVSAVAAVYYMFERTPVQVPAQDPGSPQGSASHEAPGGLLAPAAAISQGC
jgi:uncharacterized membrane protein